MLLKPDVRVGAVRAARVGSVGIVAVGAAVCAVAAQPAARHAAPADVAIVNASIWTGAPTDRAAGRTVSAPVALAVQGQRIVAVGDAVSVRARIGPKTRVIDARGRRVIPGITDSHTHMVSGGLQLGRLHLRDVRSRDAFIRAVADEAKTKAPGAWVIGGRWSVESWADPQPPDKGWLDPVTGDKPVFLTRMDGHQALVNSAALRLAGIDARGPADPAGGEIVRDPTTGEPTGILKESAMGLVAAHMPDTTPAERYDAFRRAMRHANALGVTSVHDMCSLADLDVFRRAYKAGEMTVRVNAYLSVSDWAAHVDKLDGYGLHNAMVHLHGFKGFMDGSLGSRTAYMRAPYRDATAETRYPRGQLNDMADPPEAFKALVAMADGHGVQLAVHAIGDEANHLLLDAYAYAAGRNGARDARHRVEHAQHLLMPDIPRFAALGVVASMQPFHKADDGRYADEALEPERLAGSYAYRQLLSAGALLVFGSDWPVVTMDPFAGIDAAVNARTLDGKVWLPSHSIGVEAAIRAYTVSPQHAVHRERRLGTLQVGKLADLVILSADPLTMRRENVGAVRAVLTMVDGRVVFEREE
ncbi:MAG: amidohydrolase [Phycisphaerae bacterium]